MLTIALLMPLLGCGAYHETKGSNESPLDQNKPLLPTFESIKAGVLEPKCVSCHRPGGRATNIPLLTKSDLLESRYDIVIPGNAEESGIVIVLQEGARKKMPPRESGIPGVTAEQLATIRLWIDNGAKD